VNRRDAVVVTAVAALLVAGIVATRRDRMPPPDVERSPAPMVTGSPAVDQAPPPGREARLPRLATALPSEIALDPETVVPLSAEPVGRALALFEIGTAESRGPGLLYVLGDDTRLRVLDVVSLAPAVDAANNPHSPFGTAVLKPDGTQAAFPQRDRVVLVDLTTATARGLRVPGRNLRVVWLGEQLLVVQPQATVQVDPSTGRVTPRPYTGSGLVAGLPQGAPVLDVVSQAGSWLVRSWSDSAPAFAVPVPALPVDADWLQPGWAHQSWVALDFRSFGAQPAPDLTDRSESVVVFVPYTGRMVSGLVLTSDEPAVRPPGCCAVLGWLNERAVLLDVPGQGHWILAWDPLTGRVFRVARITSFGGHLAMSVVDGAYL
jgi:hypothetical protein